MNQYLKTIQDFLQKNNQLTEQDKEALLKTIGDADKQWSITEFKLDRTEKVKKTTAILLEQTIKELERKRKAVEAQNRELEIESALEKVRSSALAMKQPADMLEVCKIISYQLASLNVKEIRNVQTAIFYETKGTYINYEYYPKHDKLLITEVDYKNHPLQMAFANQMLQGKGKVFTRSLKGKELHDWYEHQKTTNQFADAYLETADSLNYHWHSLGPVALGISTYFPLKEDEAELFKRFRNVFELAYRRYLDIETAEEQAREAKIETALERVRARTMAMQRSNELSETAFILFQQFRFLGEQPIQITIGIFNEKENVVEFRITGGEGSGSKIDQAFNASIDEPTLINKIYSAWKENKKSAVIELTGKELLDWISYRNAISGEYAHDTKVSLDDRRFVAVGYFSKGLLSISTKEPVSPQAIELLERFATAFDLSYTRFQDLKYAEAQAREAQIELGLERVRAKTMAMQKSDELLETSKVLFQQFQELGEPADQLTIGIVKESENVVEVSATFQGNILQQTFRHRIDEPIVMNKIVQGWKSQKKSMVLKVKGKQLEAYNQYRNELVGSEMFPTKLPTESQRILQVAYFSKGMLALGTNEPRPSESLQLLERFAAVFDLTYTRFLDLKNAEAQAREAKTEAALERVRAKAMAMHKSEDLHSAIATVFEELDKMNLGLIRCGIAILDKEKPRGDIWIAIKSEKGNAVQVSGDEPLDSHPLLQNSYDAWRKHEDLYYVLRDDDLLSYYEAITKTNFQQPISATFHSEQKAQQQYYFNAVFQDGSLFAFLDSEFTDEAKLVMKRFANVFNLTYKRFLDLQKAEAQAREAQIEAALERVRSRTMAMHKSEELQEVILVVSEQLQQLKFRFSNVSFIVNNEEYDLHFWSAAPMLPYPFELHIPFFDHIAVNHLKEAQKNGLDFFADILTPDENNQWLRHMIENSALRQAPDDIKNYLLSRGALARSLVLTRHITFVIGKYAAVPYTEEENAVFKRFANVFEQSYTRFLDLQKAEAQAREAQIEAALERVRARAMAMHRSDDVNSAIAIVFEEMEKLNLETLRCGIAIMDKEKRTGDMWTTVKSGEGSILQVTGNESMDIHPLSRGGFDAWMEQKDFSYTLEGEDSKSYYTAMVTQTTFTLPESHSLALLTEGDKQYLHAVPFEAGNLYAWRDTPFPEEAKSVMKRFANVFNLTYKRFLDIQKAEGQAREATIEAALERVRGRAMAMHNSNDLSSTASMVFTELRKLGINPIRCGVGLLTKESRKAQLYSATSSADGDSLSLVGWVILSGHPVLESIYETWLKNEDSFPELSGEQLKLYYEKLLSGLSLPSVPDWQSGQKQYGHFLQFSIGCLYAWADRPYNEAEIKILKRFASIIDLTFRRYMELQMSEANTKEAVKQAALDRVRAEIASMRTIADLDRITPLIWNELTILGIPFIRCGVFIMDESQKLIHTFLSTPDGKAIAAFHIPYDTPGNISQVLSHWKDKKIYADHWDEAAFTEFAGTLVKQGALASPEQYLKTIPHGGFYLHFLPFLQGMLYVGNTTHLGEEEIKLIQSLADAFSTAYARYEDFNKLEGAKQQIEKTLVDLRQTQQQLIQSEKMASLGELTAGIAHEIQNPLNFVNNFSEVSNELLDEMKAELEEGDANEAKAIADDVKQNLEKILHHGKRADAIVKGMLQHSRTSTGQKELTDVNILADEYLRLAYHGLRAKDKTFNAKFETDLDKSINKINIIPQDIGRVILNLINNAFYTVTEKKRQLNGIYEPTVSVSTKKLKDKIEIKVKDNGNGIPQKVLDKIFQPFFTTKPTGQGTGLGLSLSYDIVKAHGGELKVETKEGEGAEFIIQLPNA